MFSHRFCGPWRRFVLLGLILCLPGLAGCGGPKKGTVSGTITYKSEPLGNGVVVFIGEGNKDGSPAIGGSSPIGPDGTYKISNIPVGPMKITVETHPPPPGFKYTTTKTPHMEKNMMEAPKPLQPINNTPSRYVKIPNHYKFADHSGLSYEVTPGVQQHDISLE